MSGDPYGEAPAPAPTPSPPPPAPPLPPPRYGNRAANAIVRFAQPFIYGSRPTSADGNTSTDRGSSLSRLGLGRSSRRDTAPSCQSTKHTTNGCCSPLSSKSTAHKTGIPIAALDISPYKTHAILAGRDILKTVQVSGSACAEEFNLRSAIIAYASTHNATQGAISARHKDQLAANDVKWSHGRFDSTIATAAANGQIVVYDINRPGVELARLHEHNRQVHRVAFNPHQGALLLSGSQDATIRLWDLRDLAGDRSVMTCQSRFRYPGNNEGVRDLGWSPTNGVEFAAATDNGVIQRWDFRRDNAPILKINAHEKTCHSIDWHPDGKHLVSGGADKNVKIWDFSSTDRRMKPCWQLRAPRGILNIRWRPPCWASEGQNIGSWQCTQLATSYDHQDSRIHIWDLRRPFMPFREVDRYETAPTAMLWHSENLLWTAGIAGMFTQTDMIFAPKVSDRRSLNVVATAPDGQISFFSEKRGRKRRSLDHLSEAFLQRSNNLPISGEKLSGSQSATEGSLEETSLLSSSFKNRHRRPPSTRSSKSLASTPPSASTGGPVARLDESLEAQYIYRPAQVAACGLITGLFDIHVFKFLANQYGVSMDRTAKDNACDLHQLLSEWSKANAMLATYVGQYREAQTWKILSLAIENEIRFHANFRHTRINSGHDEPVRRPQLSSQVPISVLEESTQESVSGALLRKNSAPLILENGSNMTTPIARPMPDPLTQAEAPRNLFFPDEEESLRLPGPAWEKRLHAPQANTSSKLVQMMSSKAGSGKAEKENVHGPDLLQHTHHSKGNGGPSPALVGFPDIESTMMERRAAIESYRPKPRDLVRLDQPMQSPAEGVLAPRLDRHDSNESFQNSQMFSASEGSSFPPDSLPDSFSVTDSFGSTQEPQRPQLTSEPHTDIRGSNHDDLNWRFEPEPDATGGASPGRPSSSLLRNNSDPCFITDPEILSTANVTSPAILRPSHPDPPIIHIEDIDNGHDATDYPAHNKPESVTCGIPSGLSPAPSGLLHSPPWTSSAMLEPLIAYYASNLSSVQLPTQLLLTLAPLISHSIPPALVLSVLLTYHGQLTSLSLHCQAAHIRNLAYPDYPDVSDHGSYGITPGGPWCTVCQKPSKGDRPRYCERCNEPWAPCPICNGEGPITLADSDVNEAIESENTQAQGAGSLWAWCQGCGHGGHVGCLRVWWDDDSSSEGGCATDGCLHDCVMGTRREEVLRRMGDGKKTGIVKGDEWIVGESRAVEEARGLVVGANATRNGKGGVTLRRQNSPRGLGARKAPPRGNLGPRTGSGGKKVRLVVPEEGGETGSRREGNTLDRTSASAP